MGYSTVNNDAVTVGQLKFTSKKLFLGLIAGIALSLTEYLGNVGLMYVKRVLAWPIAPLGHKPINFYHHSEVG